MKDKWTEPRVLNALKEKMLLGMKDSGLSVEKVWKNFVLKNEDDPIDYPVSHVLVDLLGIEYLQEQKANWKGTGQTIYPIDLIVASGRLYALDAFLSLGVYPISDDFKHYHQLIFGAQKIGHNQVAAMLLKHAKAHHSDYFDEKSL